MGRPSRKSAFRSLKVDAIKRMSWSAACKYVVGAINMVNPHIHKLRLSSNYTLKELDRILGPLKVDDKFTSKKRMPNYQGKAIKKVKGFDFVIFYWPRKGWLPQSILEVCPRAQPNLSDYRAILLWLSEGLPGLNMSSVEYAVDLRIEYGAGVETVFYTMDRCFFAPYQRQVKLFGGQLKKYGKRLSMVRRYGDDKTYERGEDHKKKDGGWLCDDFTMIRIEHTAGRDTLKKNGINTGRDLLSNLRFYDINHKRWKWCEFYRSKKLPKPWEPYQCCIEAKEHELFHRERQLMQCRVKNISQYIRPVQELQSLQLRVQSAMRQIDQSWHN